MRFAYLAIQDPAAPSPPNDASLPLSLQAVVVASTSRGDRSAHLRSSPRTSTLVQRYGARVPYLEGLPADLGRRFHQGWSVHDLYVLTSTTGSGRNKVP